MRRVLFPSVVIASLMLAPAVLAQGTRAGAIAAEQEKKAHNTTPDKPWIGHQVTDWVQTHLDWVKPRDPSHDGFWIRPHVGGITRGAGFAVGPDVTVPIVRQWLELRGFGSVSLRGYRLARGELVAPHLLKDHLELAAGAAYRYFPEEDFWGVGPDSIGPRTSYLLENRDYYASMRLRLGTFTTVGALGGFLHPRPGPGRDRRFPSTEQILTPTVTPGLDVAPDFQYGTAFLDFDTRDNAKLVHRGSHVRLAASRYFDRTFDRFTFSAVEAMGLQAVPLLGETRLVLFGRIVSQKANAGREVPFYLMPWLGGDDSIRGYRTYRFRDLNLAQANVEYQWPVFDYMDMALFADMGNVAPRLRDLGDGGMKTAYGIGLRFHTNSRMVLRIDAALAGTGARLVVFRLRPAF